jgi:hypothetical protein
LTIAILIGYRYGITLWDWIKLLIVPTVIAGGGIWFNRQQRDRELDIAERRTQDEALQAYLDQMSSMLIPNKDQPSLYKARPGDSLSSVARARTLTMLPRLDGRRKARVVQFLYESGLVSTGHRVVDLRGADLENASLSEADLTRADLSGTVLYGADLSRARMWSANLATATLEDADLRRAELGHANLADANLAGANLSLSELSWTNLNGAELEHAELWRTSLVEASMIEADLRGSNLSEANLRRADLFKATLGGLN